ncbi:mate-domain-containing protein [Dichotomocladium elegans]|nr:mate-domain-containing protein [Dichotomocladium elegans]
MRLDQDDTQSTKSSVSSTATETSPLLESLSRTSTHDRSTWYTEFRWLLFNSLPVVGTYLLQNTLQIACVLTLGRLGPTELAASGLATMFANFSAWSVILGTATALDTLCSQAWTGARDRRQVGVHLQQALLILGIILIPVGLVWWNATRILLGLNQDRVLAEHAGLFLRWFLLGVPAFVAFECVKKYLQAQGIMEASTYAMVVVSPINFGLNYLLVHWEPIALGFIGAPIATAISYWLMLSLLLGYIHFFKGGCSEAWGGWSREALHGWWPFLKLAIPGILLVCSEWWAFELAALAASYLGTVDLAAQSVLQTSISATFTIPYGISVAASNRVGNALGGSDGLMAKRASTVALIFAVGFAALNSTFLMVSRHGFGYLFTSDPQVVARIASIMPVCALFQLTDGLCGVGGGVFRGMGRQHIAAWINLFAYYVVALPVGYMLTFRIGWGLIGVWLGLSLALLIGALGECSFLLTTDWNKEVRRTQLRLKTESDPWE